jgi:hypothetical protein
MPIEPNTGEWVPSPKSTQRPYRTWKCNKCGYEFDYLTYGGPCPGSEGQGCGGELHRRKVTNRTLPPLDLFEGDPRLSAEVLATAWSSDAESQDTSKMTT